VSHQPEIPDAVSAEALTSLLGQCRRAPISTVIPALDLGGTLGGACDLQFVITQIIHRSCTGTNLVQMLVAACHLLTEVEGHLGDQLQRLQQQQPPYDQASAAEQRAVDCLLRSHRHCAQLALAQLEPLLQALSLSTYRERARQLQDGPLAGQDRLPLEQLRSHLLISDELIASLQLERDAITTYLNHHATDDT
jgi:hypothetical protein